LKNLLQTHSISWAQSVKITLESEGIPSVVLDENAPGYLGFAGRTRVAVLNDGDLPRAQQILSRLTPPALAPPASWRLQKRGLLFLAGAFLLLLVSAVLFDADGPRYLVLGAIVAGVLSFVLGLILIALGPRADRENR
jgi:hypothetical protein